MSMPLRAGYKRTEVGVIPEDWEVKPFGKLFAFSNGVNADKGSYGRGLRFVNVLEPITYSHIYGPEITGRISVSDSVAAAHAVRFGDVLFNRTSETDTELGLATTYLGTEHVLFGGFVIRGHPTNHSLDPKYSGYALRAQVIRSQIIPMGQGAVRANIGQQSLKLVVAPIPPLPEQRAIAEALSDADALIESLEQLVAKKLHLKQGAMQELLTGQKRLPGFQVKTGHKQTEVGVIPEDWEVRPLHSLAEKIMVGIASAATHAYRDRGVVMFRNQNIKPGYLDDSEVLHIAEDYEEAFRNKRLKGGDLLTARTGYPGTTSIVPLQYEGAQSFTTLITRPRRGVIDSEYLCIFINSEAGQAFFEQNQIGGGQKNVNAGSLKNLPVAFPPTKAEQEAIATILSNMDTEIAELESQLTKARTIKQGMMHQLLTGKIRLI